MSKILRNMRVNGRSAADEKALRLKDRFRAVSNKSFRDRSSWDFSASVPLLVLAFLLAFLSFTYWALPFFSPWSRSVTLLHLASAPNCDAARSVGLAPANRGEPGYWSKHDADNDGIACEPWPR
ncbi:excalibur calcium-binding domain-containing protein [Roseibium aggregatum]|uniref:excalibur calcium-binding domain-containing protein n=1 Tax=Roseibium aggregatum TaxID=187304 RepID=UPI0018DC9077|nr:excalibur calcium-binding domain-containing protein [Roseibium aggregatum]